MHMLHPTRCYSVAKSQFVTAPLFWATQGVTLKFEAVQSTAGLGRLDICSWSTKIDVECLIGLTTRCNGRCWSSHVILDTAIEYPAICFSFRMVIEKINIEGLKCSMIWHLLVTIHI
jgi:hypothetical protein